MTERVRPRAASDPSKRLYHLLLSIYTCTYPSGDRETVVAEYPSMLYAAMGHSHWTAKSHERT